jgi:predicted alpha/beta-hydrolase family hydrolase
VATFVLPGYSSKNKVWSESCAKEISLNHEVKPVFWNHWTDSKITFNAIDYAKEVAELFSDEQVNILAKSIGTLVASTIVKSSPDKIQKVIFCGIPLNGISKADRQTIKVFMESFPAEKILCFQNENDPLGTFIEVKKFVAEANPKIKVIKKPGDDHNYPYYKDFETFLKA